ncbi:AfsR/SARP family transcriptional regulator [Paractinoplanes toevensis]|nr:BTAD domain-containing putative transcriptional regulator [Actinoplanes toevensis]
MAVDEGSLDLLRFRRLVTQARQEEPGQALSLYAEALGLWHGPVAANLDPGSRDHPVFGTIEREHAAAVEGFARTALHHGEVSMALPMLVEAAERHPLDEAVQAQLLILLAASGKQAEAVSRYEQIRRRLADELGVDPGNALRTAYEQVLRQEFLIPAEGATAPATQTAQNITDTPRREAVSAPSRPAQLPLDQRIFAPRPEVVSQVHTLVQDAVTSGPASVVVVLEGMPGIGKTTTAIHLAHKLIDQYPDGQLYINLHGFDENDAALTAEEALQNLIMGLGVDQGSIPAGRQAMAGMYRTLLSGRKVLVVLDNARDIDQVSDLLPGAAGCLTLVTSRRRLTWLRATAGAHVISLDLPDRQQARSYLAPYIGHDRIADDSHVIDAIIDQCGRLPLALAIVGVRAASYPTLSMNELLADLSAAPERLDAWQSDGVPGGVRAIFATSYRQLSAAAARMFRLLSLHPGADLTGPIAASLAAVPTRVAHAAMQEIQQVGLMREDRPGRFSWHNLVRSYAGELRDELEPSLEQQRAMERLLLHYWHTASKAPRRHEPSLEAPPWSPESPGVTQQVFPDAEAALSWFESEQHTYHSMIRYAAEHQYAEIAWRLAYALRPYQQLRARWQDWLDLATVVLQAVQHADNAQGAAYTHHSIAGALYWHARFDEALEHLDSAGRLFEQLGLARATAHLPLSTAQVLVETGRLPEAYEHAHRAQRLLRAQGDERGEAKAWYFIAVTHIGEGSVEDAREPLESAIKGSRRAGDPVGEGAALSLLGDTLKQAGNYEQALRNYERSLDLQREAGHVVNLSDGYLSLAECHLALGDEEAAEDLCARALTLVPALALANSPAGIHMRALMEQGRLPLVHGGTGE